jgi:hypothetical protein
MNELPGTRSRGNTVEIWRRVVPAALVLTAALLAFLATTRPLVRIEVVDFKQEQEDMGSFYGIWTEEDRRLKMLPVAQYIAEVTKGKTVAAGGATWQEFVAALRFTQEGNPPNRTWSLRTGEWDTVYAYAADVPDARVTEGLSDGDERYALLDDGTYMRAVMVKLDEGDFGLGSGLHGPPPALAYPGRPWSLGLLALAVLVYVLLPWRRRRDGVLSVARWRVVLGDLVGLMLTAVFFTMPLLITSNTVLAVTSYWFLTLIFWLIALLGAWALQVAAFYGGLELELAEDRLVRTTYTWREEYPYSSMSFVQPAVQRPPRWLVIASWLTALSGRGAGNALIVSGMEYQGLRIVMQDGRKLELWTTDQLGGSTMAGSAAILERLRAAGVPVIEDTAVSNAMGVS